MTYEKVKDVKYFFTEEQWTRMGEYERNICRNQLEFYKFKKLKLGELLGINLLKLGFNLIYFFFS